MKNVLKHSKEELLVAFVSLLAVGTLTFLMIHQYAPLFLRGGRLGFWSLFSGHFRMSGYDCWSYITLSNEHIFFVASRHPLFFSLLEPLYQLNHWLMMKTEINFAVIIIGVITLFCATYSLVFLYRIMRQVMRLKCFDAAILTTLFFSIAHVMVAMIVPDHFVLSLFMLTLTLYLCGMALRNNTVLSNVKLAILLFFTSGIALSNGAKTILGALFTNGWKRILHWKYIVGGALVPLALLGGIYAWQYYAYEVPQAAKVRRVENAKRKANPDFEKQHESHKKWKESTTGKPMGNGIIGQLTDCSTSRMATLVHNFFGEGIQLHKEHLLEDMNFSRPVLLKYRNWWNYLVEILVITLLCAGLFIGRKDKFVQLVMAWMSMDLILHIGLGFAINEVYIMTSGWAFIIPIAFACILRSLGGRKLLAGRVLFGTLTLFLLAYNATLLVSYLSQPYMQLIKDI